MASELSHDEVRKVAKLARLSLSDGQVERYRGQLAAVLGYIDQIAEVNIEGVEPMTHPSDLVSRLDDDIVGPSLPRDQALRNAPESREGYIVVPKVIDGGGEESEAGG